MKEGLYSVTVTYNPDLKNNILQKQMEFLILNNIHPIIVDNASKNIEQLRDCVKEISNGIKVLTLLENYGIGRALNIGISECLKNIDCEWILTLDQDTYFYANSFTELYKTMDSHASESIAIFGFNYERLRFNRKNFVNNLGKPTFSHFIITSGTLARRRVYKSIKYDESLFMYFVDNDFCIRALRSGYKILICSEAKMIHEEGERLMKHGVEYFFMQPNRLFYVGRNSLLMFFRYKKVKPLAYLALIILENVVAGVSIKATLSFSIKGIFASLFHKNLLE